MALTNQPSEAQSNGYIKKIHMVGVVAGMAVTIIGFAFHVGSVNATVDSRLMQTESNVKMITEDYVRKDVVEQRLLNIEQSEKRIEAQLDLLNKMLIERVK